MLPLHDRTAGTVAWRLIHEVLALVPGDDKLGVELEHHTGGRNINPPIWLITVLDLISPTPKAKLADAGIYTLQSGLELKWPGIQIEVGFSDTLQETRRDISLWLDYSDCHVGFLSIKLTGQGKMCNNCKNKCWE